MADAFALALSPHLAERLRPVTASDGGEDGEFVLYWMQTACRGHENPALDVALLVAAAWERPVLVAAQLRDDAPFASDRHHTFWLEGLADAFAELRERGIAHALYRVSREDADTPVAALARRAALVVTDDMPVDPWRRWTTSLAASVQTAVWAVDTACVVPMRVAGRAFDRAYAFRSATLRARKTRLGSPWPEVAEGERATPPEDLPYQPIDFRRTPISEIVAGSKVDHGVGPVEHTRGGARAGYARWTDFRINRLRQYGRRRNDAIDSAGISRMSAYLHLGQVSPFRIAREAHEDGSDGAEKYLDELLTWRELSYAWCFYRPDHAAAPALPEWALATLSSHAGDARPARYSWETLARGRTGDPLWNAAQRSLVIHGELHNNVRMTWGKALLTWTDGPRECLDTLVELNHRYALDGQDPNSYGGLLWCLGLFDRPFAPEQPIIGTVRPRSTTQHARRLDVAAYARQTARPARRSPPRVAVVGAGIAGLTAARTLADHGYTVSVFDKGRGPGGRCATRRTESGLTFDHGAQYFTAQDTSFRRLVDSWCEDGVVAAWTAEIAVVDSDRRTDPADDARRYVGFPGMSGIARHLAANLAITYGAQVTAIERAGSTWQLRLGNGRTIGGFDVTLVAVPAPQLAPLLTAAPDLAAGLSDVRMDPCWAVMVGCRPQARTEIDAGFVGAGPIAWICRNAAKPGRDRSAGDTWVVHAAADWSRRHLELEPETVVRQLLPLFGPLAGADPDTIEHAVAHRWRYAKVTSPLGEACLFDPQRGIGAAGDWCLGPRIEAAFLSGLALAGRVMGTGDPS